MLPGPRVVLNAPSKAIDEIKADKSDPFRVVGVQWNLFGNYSAVYGLEDIRSCAPLSNGEFINLIRKFPGVELRKGWIIEVVAPFAAQPLLNLLNVKYLLTPPRVVLQEGLDFRLKDRSDFGIEENLEVWPRAFFSDQVVSISSTEEFIQQLLENGKEPVHRPDSGRNRKTARLATIANGKESHRSGCNELSAPSQFHRVRYSRAICGNGVPHGRTGERFYCPGQQRTQRSPDDQPRVQRCVSRPAGKLPSGVHLPSAPLAAGLRLVLDCGGECHRVGLREFYPAAFKKGKYLMVIYLKFST